MAAGYKGWVYTDAASPSRPVLRVASGEKKMMNIQLEPLPTNSATRWIQLHSNTCARRRCNTESTLRWVPRG